MACRLATWPTSRWPSSVKATTDGVVRAPSALGITSAWPPSRVAATTELVVPRSIPTALAILPLLSQLYQLARARRGRPQSSAVGRERRFQHPLWLTGGPSAVNLPRTQ